MDQITLTPSQHFVLAYAIEFHDGKIVKYPEGVRGGAQKKVLKGLFDRALVTPSGTDWFVAAEGYDALGKARPSPIAEDAAEPIDLDADPADPPPAVASDPALEAEVAAAEATFLRPATVRRSRDNSKQATVIAMLARPEGATIAQICEATGWQAHTVRGTFAGTLKKKLGITLVSEKGDAAVGGERVYHIIEAAASETSR